MADFPGIDFTAQPRGLFPPSLSADVSAGDFAGGFPLSIAPFELAGSDGVGHPAVSIVHHDHTGFHQELFGGELFERVIVIPRVKALGYVLSATQFAIEVWNAFRNVDHTLAAIVITGAGGVVVADPHGEPLVYGALDSYIYQATMPTSGPTQIDQDIVFQFEVGVLGTDVVVTGSRIVVFSVRPEWGGGVQETISFLTDVFKAYSDNEQRRGLRQFARRGLKYRALALTARDAAGMESLVWGWQNQPYGVPWWPDASAMTSDTPAGSFSIACVTTDRLFAVGGIAVIWTDEFTFEALTITDVTDDSIAVSSPTQFSWKAGLATLVLPALLCRLGNHVEVDRLFSGADQIDLEFIGEAQQPAPAPTVTLTQYLGFDVLESMPNWATTLKRGYVRSLVTLDPKIGPITVVDKGGSAIVTQEFPWYLADHAAVTVLRAFLLARFGQLHPFWIPTWDQDLVLANDVAAIDGTITIESEFYTRFFFPNKARQYIAFIPIDGSGNVYRHITASVDNGDGTETLTLDSATAKAFAADSTMISFLTLARLSTDDAAIDWMSSDLAQASLQIQEVPREVP
jgi:hypothetical protein